MKKNILIWIFTIAQIVSYAQTVLYSESFETDGEGTRYVSNTYYEASPNCNFFCRTTATPLEPCFQNNFFSNFQGNFFWGSEDIMNSPGIRPPGQITSSNISIAGHTSLQFSLYLATGNNVLPTNTRWETADSINIQISIDGGPFRTIGRFMGNAAFGGDLIKDLNLNGIADVGEPVASVNAFSQHTFNITGSGTNAQIRIDCDQLGGSEELGLDAFQLTGIFSAPPLTATQSQVNASCNGLCNGSATVVASGGTAPYSYAWAPSGGTAATASSLCAGTYTCTITDAASNNITRTFSITQPTAIVLNANSQTNVSCFGGTNGAASVNAASGGAGGYTYNWTPGNPTGDGTVSVTGLIAGTWTCTVTDANSCTATRTFNITSPTAIVVTPASQTNISCNGGNNGAASINTPTGGAGGYTYNWTPGNPTGDGTVSVTGLTAGTWTCTVTDANSCTATQTFNITQPPSIVVTAASQTNIACNGGTNGAASINTPTGGAGSFTYNWTPGNPTGDGTVSVTGLVAGSWTCTVTDANSCTATQTFNITQPTTLLLTAASQSNLSCNTSNNGTASVNAATGGAGGYSYNWTPGNPTGDGTTSVTGLTAGTWTCTATDANGCTATQTFIITAPAALTSSPASQSNISCAGGNNGAASINTPTGGTGGYTYNWTPGNPSGDGTTSVTGLTVGTWVCMIGDGNFCTTTVTFNITAPTPLALTGSGQTNVSCSGGSDGSVCVNAASGGTSPYVYNWTPGNPTGDGTVCVTGLTQGVWDCTVTDANGCTATRTFNITAPTPITANISATPTSCTANTGTASVSSVTGGAGGYTYSWAPTGGTAATASNIAAGTYTCTITDASSCTVTRTVVVATSSGPSLSAASQTNISCFGGNNGAASVNAATGGTAPYSYNWTPGNPSGDGTVSVTGLTAGSWTCTVTDANGCTAAVSFNITAPTTIVLNANAQTNISCFGGTNGATSVTAATGGAGGYTYNWTPGNPTGDGTVSVTGLTAGTWTCTVTDANSCTATQTFNITSPTALVLNSNTQSNVSCFGGSNGAASVLPAIGGAGGYTYNWTPGNPTGDGTVSVTGLTAGTWTCTVTDLNGCVATRTFNITSPTPISATPTLLNNITCFGGSNGSITLFVIGGTPGYTYNWAPGNPNGDGTPSVTGLTAGTWSCTVTDANGCVIQPAFTITSPPAIALTATATPTVICAGQSAVIAASATGGSGSFSYVWTPGSLNGPSHTVTPTTTTTYTVVSTDANTCTASTVLTVSVNPLPAVALSGTNHFCPGGSTLLTGTSGGTSQWYRNGVAIVGANTNTYLATTAGVYNMRKTNTNGCGDSAAVGITVTIDTPPAIASVTSSAVLCFGNSNGSATVSATGTPSLSYSWAPSGGTSATASALAAGNYTVTVTDGNTCTSTATVAVTSPAVLNTAPSQVNSTCFGGNDASASVAVTGGTAMYTYLWTPVLPPTPSANSLTAGSYSCLVTDMNGCTSTATFNITEPALITSSQSVTICNGDSLVVGTSVYSTAGTYIDTLTSVIGCDSVVTTSLAVNPVPSVVSVTSAAVCDSGSVTLGAAASGGANLTWYSDSLLTVNVNSGNTYTTPLLFTTTTYYVQADSAGCYSAVVPVTVTVNTGAVTINQSLTLCFGDSVTIGSNTYYASGVYADTINFGGCDSIFNSTITVLNQINASQTLTICSGQSVTVGANTYTATGIYMDTIAAVNGCDSLVTTDLTVTLPDSSAQAVTVCNGGSYSIGSNTYTASGVYADTLANINGCDSVVTTTLTVLPANIVNQNITLCAGDSINVGNSVYYTAGTYSDTIADINGCDSIINTVVNINTVDVSVTVTGFGGTLMSNASGPNTSWLWLNCQDNTPIISATLQSYSPSANGQFAVIVTQSGCTDTSTCFSINSVGIDENSAINFSIYPNPANDIITVQTQIGATIVIFDAIGNQVAASKATNTKTDIAVDQLANGIYFVKVISNNNEETQKLIISK